MISTSSAGEPRGPWVRATLQRHPGRETDQVVTMAGLSQDEALLAAPHPEPPGERPVIGLAVNLAVNGLQFVRVRSGLPAVESLKRCVRRGHDRLLR
jgi:hypothetical protein